MIKQEECAGVIPLRKREDGSWEILLALHVKGHYWAFPKGHIHAQENPFSAAERELFEELGLKIDKLYGVQPLKEEFTFERNEEQIQKKVTYYPAFVKGEMELKEPEELLEAKWFPLEEGVSKITFETTKKLLDPLLQSLLTN